MRGLRGGRGQLVHMTMMAVMAMMAIVMVRTVRIVLLWKVGKPKVLKLIRVGLVIMGSGPRRYTLHKGGMVHHLPGEAGTGPTPPGAEGQQGRGVVPAPLPGRAVQLCSGGPHPQSRTHHAHHTHVRRRGVPGGLCSAPPQARYRGTFALGKVPLPRSGSSMRGCRPLARGSAGSAGSACPLPAVTF